MDENCLGGKFWGTNCPGGFVKGEMMGDGKSTQPLLTSYLHFIIPTYSQY